MFYLHCEVDALTKRFSHQSQHCSLLKRQINLLRNYTLCTTEGNDEQMPISLAYFSHLWMQVLYTFWVMGLQQFSMTEVASLENPLFVNLFSISRMLEVEVSVEDASSRDGLAGTGDWFWTAVLGLPGQQRLRQRPPQLHWPRGNYDYSWLAVSPHLLHHSQDYTERRKGIEVKCFPRQRECIDRLSLRICSKWDTTRSLSVHCNCKWIHWRGD